MQLLTISESTVSVGCQALIGIYNREGNLMSRIARGLIGLAFGIAAGACNTDLQPDDKVIDTVPHVGSNCCAPCDIGPPVCASCPGRCIALDDGVSCPDSDEFFSCPLPPPSCPALSIFLPNVMTPNGDVFNDLWVVADANGGTGYTYAKSFLLLIDDRDGQRVRTAEGANRPGDPYIPGGQITWDGKSDNTGQLVATGTYYYALTLTDCGGTSFSYNGWISVLY